MNAADEAELKRILEILRSGRTAEAIPPLERLSRSAPASASVLYNLGIAYGELGQHDESIIRLKRAVQIDPGHAHAWVGIGTAYSRRGNNALALEAFEKAVEVAPSDGYALRNLGGTLVAEGRGAEAVAHLRQALELLPDDPGTIFGLAAALETADAEASVEEADALYLRVIEEYPDTQQAREARDARTAYAQRVLQKRSIAGFRPDVIMYILGALKTFQDVGDERRRHVAHEIALLGQAGLDINDSSEKYTLKSLPGKFSGLHLLSIMYAGFKQIDPALRSGADFAKEYDAAMKMFLSEGPRAGA